MIFFINFPNCKRNYLWVIFYFDIVGLPILKVKDRTRG